MRILWAFYIKPKPSAAGRAFDPADYRGGMPGTAGTGLPVTLVVREERRAVIEEAYRRDVEERGECVVSCLSPALFGFRFLVLDEADDLVLLGYARWLGYGQFSVYARLTEFGEVKFP